MYNYSCSYNSLCFGSAHHKLLHIEALLYISSQQTPPDLLCQPLQLGLPFPVPKHSTFIKTQHVKKTKWKILEGSTWSKFNGVSTKRYIIMKWRMTQTVVIIKEAEIRWIYFQNWNFLLKHPISFCVCVSGSDKSTGETSLFLWPWWTDLCCRSWIAGHKIVRPSCFWQGKMQIQSVSC